MLLVVDTNSEVGTLTAATAAGVTDLLLMLMEGVTNADVTERRVTRDASSSFIMVKKKVKVGVKKKFPHVAGRKFPFL